MLPGWRRSARHMGLAHRASVARCCWGGGFFTDGKLLAVQLRGRVQLWDTATWESSFLQTRRGIGFWAELVFSPDGRLLGAPLDNVWNVSSHSAEFDTRFSCSLAFAPGGKWLAAGYQDGGLKIWNMETREVVFTNKAHSSFLQGLAFSPDGQILATGGGNQVIHCGAGRRRLPARRHSRNFAPFTATKMRSGPWIFRATDGF